MRLVAEPSRAAILLKFSSSFSSFFAITIIFIIATARKKKNIYFSVLFVFDRKEEDLFNCYLFMKNSLDYDKSHLFENF